MCSFDVLAGIGKFLNTGKFLSTDLSGYSLILKIL